MNIKAYTDKLKKQKRSEDIYHFHKDCSHYQQCTETVDKLDRHDVIRFYCPALGRTQPYYQRDLHAIKFACTKFEPMQPTLFEYVDNCD